MQQNPHILIANDDGIDSPGIKKLVDLARPFGKVVVVAPEGQRSGTSQAVTVGSPISIAKSTLFKDINAYSCSGTPADCIKLGKKYVLEDFSPTLVLTGINHGTNIGTSVLYSGTVGGAMEGALSKVPAIGFSLDEEQWNAQMDHTDEAIRYLIALALREESLKGAVLNVNFPAAQGNRALAGLRVCKQATISYQEQVNVYEPLGGKRYFWVNGAIDRAKTSEKGDDLAALKEYYAAVVPVRLDLTDSDRVEQVRSALHHYSDKIGA